MLDMIAIPYEHKTQYIKDWFLKVGGNITWFFGKGPFFDTCFEKKTALPIIVLVNCTERLSSRFSKQLFNHQK